MFHRIVVPLDGSSFAESALGPARALAEAFNSQLLIVRAEAATGLPQVATSTTESAQIQDEWKRLGAADAYLNEIVVDLRASGLSADYALTLSDADHGIAQIARLHEADTILLASHPRWALADPQQPSTARNLHMETRMPLLVYRPARNGVEHRAEASAADSPPLAGADSPVIVLLDGSRLAEAALPYAQALARAFQSYLALTQTLPPGTSQAETKQAETYLELMCQEVVRSGDHAMTAVVYCAPASGIESIGRQLNSSLIVMTSHGQSHPSNVWLGSVAARGVGKPALRVHRATTRSSLRRAS